MEYNNTFLSEHYVYSCNLYYIMLYCDYHYYVIVAFLFNSDDWLD